MSAAARRDDGRRGPVRVAHSHPEWLAGTQTWMYGQVRHAPARRVENHVVCERTANLDQFAVPHLHTLEDASRAYRAWDRGLRRLRLRRHPGLLVRIGRALGVRVVHSHFGNVGWADRGAARRLGART
jgi:colanic acid/amylovoran biosynthesis glycosyltransferase